jgi:putative hydrolase of the HAD superfamily
VLFDLGGVLVDFSFDRALAHWAAYSALSIEQLKQRFAHDLPYQRHERGEIASRDYFDHLAATLQLSATQDEIARGWNDIFIGEINETRALLEQVRNRIPCFAFTNTNAEHMAVWTALYPDMFAAFKQVFASHEIGLRKPERAAFDYICRHTGVSAASFLFFDDLEENVAGARVAGLQAVQVRSPADVEAALRGFGVLP